MDAVTYSQNDVASFINAHMIPVRVSNDQKPLCDDFSVKWTPLTVMLDKTGNPVGRILGFMEPDDLKAAVLLGTAKAAFNSEQFEDALTGIGKILNDFSQSTSAPEALFLQGVCTYLSTHNPAPLKEAYEQLVELYPESAWARRAYPYRLL